MHPVVTVAALSPGAVLRQTGCEPQPEKKGQRLPCVESMESMVELTQQAAARGASLGVWPEAWLTGDVIEGQLRADVSTVAK